MASAGDRRAESVAGRAAAAPFVRVLGELFGPRVEDSAIGLPTVPLDELYAEPAARIHRSRGGHGAPKTPARVTSLDAATIERCRPATEAIETPSRDQRGALACLRRTLGRRVRRRGIVQIAARRLARCSSSPIVTVNLWFDGPVMIGAVRRLDRRPDALGVRQERDLRRTTAGHLSVVASGADDLADMDNARLTAVAWQQLQRALPTTARRGTSVDRSSSASTARRFRWRPARRRGRQRRTSVARLLSRRRLDRHRTAGNDRGRRPERPHARLIAVLADWPIITGCRPSSSTTPSWR